MTELISNVKAVWYLAVSDQTGADSGTLEDVYEPYLIKNGFIQRTPRGRVVTDAAYAHLGISL